MIDYSKADKLFHVLQNRKKTMKQSMGDNKIIDYNKFIKMIKENLILGEEINKEIKRRLKTEEKEEPKLEENIEITNDDNRLKTEEIKEEPIIEENKINKQENKEEPIIEENPTEEIKLNELQIENNLDNPQEERKNTLEEIKEEEESKFETEEVKKEEIKIPNYLNKKYKLTSSNDVPLPPEYSTDDLDEKKIIDVLSGVEKIDWKMGIKGKNATVYQKIVSLNNLINSISIPKQIQL